MANKFQLKSILLKAWMFAVVKTAVKTNSTKYSRTEAVGLFSDN